MSSADSSRKPSGSSTRSGTHSPPSAASGNVSLHRLFRHATWLRSSCYIVGPKAQPARNLAASGTASTANLYGIGGGNGGNLKALNAGWQASTRHAGSLFFCSESIVWLLGLGLFLAFVKAQRVHVLAGQCRCWGGALDCGEVCERDVGRQCLDK